MREIWLRTNCRALWFGMLPPALLILLGICTPLVIGTASSAWPKWIAGVMIAVGIGLIVGLAIQTAQPRIAYEDGRVLFYLQHGPPLAVPVEFVEAFFVGQGPLMLPGPQRQNNATVNLVARISQRAPEWAERAVKPALGRWSDGYVTIRGTWCELLNDEVVRRLNRRLRQIREGVDEQDSAGSHPTKSNA